MDQTTEQAIRKTILVANDNPIFLASIHDFLSADFDILTANSGDEAKDKSAKFKDPIALLMSAFEFPGISGIELGTLITDQRPEIKVLLTTAFKGGLLVLNEGWHFLPTPSIKSQLSTIITGLIAPPKSKFTAVGLGGRIGVRT